jgi:transcriptional regulator with XRE-family HTH domain
MTLEQYIQQRGIPMARLGKRVGVEKRQTMWKYVKGLVLPPAEVQARIAIETGDLVRPVDHEATRAAYLESLKASSASEAA